MVHDRAMDCSTELLTSAEVAAKLRLTMAAFYNLRYRQEGPPAVRIGGRLRWRVDDVDTWVAARREPVR